VEEGLPAPPTGRQAAGRFGKTVLERSSSLGVAGFPSGSILPGAHRKKGYFLSTPFLLSYCRSWYIGLAYVNIVFYVKFSCGLIAHNTRKRHRESFAHDDGTRASCLLPS